MPALVFYHKSLIIKVPLVNNKPVLSKSSKNYHKLTTATINQTECNVSLIGKFLFFLEKIKDKSSEFYWQWRFVCQSLLQTQIYMELWDFPAGLSAICTSSLTYPQNCCNADPWQEGDDYFGKLTPWSQLPGYLVQKIILLIPIKRH